MGVRVEVVLDIQALQIQQATIQAAPQAMSDYIQQMILPLSQQRTDATINTALGPHRRPTDWQTPKQRAWWFVVGITQWFGRKQLQDWKVRNDVESEGKGQIVSVNPMPGAGFIFKPALQQRMHMGVWLDSETYAQTESSVLLQDFDTGWKAVNGV